MKATFKSRATVFFLILVLFCVGGTGYFTLEQYKQSLIAEKESKLKSVAMEAAADLPPEFFQTIAVGKPTPQRLQRLKQLVEPSMDRVARIFNTGVALVLKDPVVILMFSPAEEFDHLAGRTLTKDHPGWRVLQSGQEAVGIDHTLRGYTIAYRYPLINQGKVIGYISANELMEDTVRLEKEFAKRILVVTLIGLVLGWTGAKFLSTKVLADIDRIRTGLDRLRYDLSSPMPRIDGEMEEITQSVEQLAATLRLVQESSRSIASSLHMEDIYAKGIDVVSQLLHVDAVMIMMMDPHTGEIGSVAGKGLSPEFLDNAKVRLGEGLVGRVIQRGAPMQCSNMAEDFRIQLPQLIRSEGLISGLSVPLVGKKSTIGALTVFSKRKHYFNNNDVGLLTTLADQIALSIENAQLFSEMETLAITDRLTGLYNHKHFQEYLAKVVNEATLFNNEVSLLLLDIDYFKMYNDSFGHQEGDKLLTQLARVMSENVRPNDFVARYGGEEFAVVLNHTNVREAFEVAERIRRQVCEYPFNNREQQPTGKVTLSIGIAQFPIHANSHRELVKKADEALYKAKHTNKNTSQIYFSVLDELIPRLTTEECKQLDNIKSMISVIQGRDKYTYGHSERVLKYATAIAWQLQLSPDELEIIRYAAYLHDVGKIEVSPDILKKDQGLSAEDWRELKRHCEYGVKILKPISAFGPVLDLIAAHHEWFDGSGYPRGLRGEEIPLGARIIAVADSFDAMVGQRQNTTAKEPKEAIAELLGKKGTQFDPNVVEAFLAVLVEDVNLIVAKFGY